MPTTLTNGIQLPDKGSVDWYSSMQSNYDLIDTHLGNTDIHVTAEDKANWNSRQGSLSQAQLDAIAQVATNTSDIATLQSGKANASHTHSSSDITDIDDYATKDYVDNSISGLVGSAPDASHTHSSSDITDIGDYATKQYVDNSISSLVDNAPDALNTLNELSAALNDDSNFASTVTTTLGAKANSADLATVATSGSYTDLTDKPTIPTNTSDLTNDSDFVVSSNLATIATSGDYDDLSNKPSIPSNTSDLNNDSGFITLNDLDIPSNTSDLTNDSGFITLNDVPSVNVPTKVSQLQNDSGYLTSADLPQTEIPTKTSDLTNDSGFITSDDLPDITVPTKTSDLANDSGFVTLNDFDIPTKTSDLTNDSGFITSSDVPIGTSDLINDSNFVDTSNSAVSSGITSARVTAYDSHVADTDIHVTTTDKTTWNTVTSKANDSDVVHKSGNETINGNKTFSSINGVEPSSLSLPSDKSARVDISSYITNLGNGNDNSYTVPANGYIYLYFTSINGVICFSQTPGGLINYAQTFVRYQGNGQLYVFFPVRKGDNFVVRIYTSSTAVVQNAYFIPCQGNI